MYNSQEKKRISFNSRIGMILATAGAAVGLGNIWRFPTTTGENGGAAFIFIYILFTVFLCLPGMLGEILIGRHGGGNSMHSYSVAGGGKVWGLTGVMGMVCGAIILGFYSVVAGWCLYYLVQACFDNVLGTKEYISNEFGKLVAHPWLPSVLSIVFLLLTHIIIVRGVQKGIEKASKAMMPILVVLMFILIFASCSLPGAMSGIRFLFQPDFSKITVDVLYEAIGQSFFSLSLGAACLCTYGAYFQKEANILKSSVQIAGIDCGVAIMAGLMIFPAAFAVGLLPDAGPSLIFLTLPNVFGSAFPHPLAYVVSIMFFALLTLAALTSTISLHEIGTSLMSQELKLSRGKAAWIETVFCSVIGILSALSMGPCPMGFFGDSLFGNFDSLTSNILLPLGALITSVVVGWRMPRATVIEELTSNGRYAWAPWAFNVFMFLIRFFMPACIIVIVLSKWGAI